MKRIGLHRSLTTSRTTGFPARGGASGGVWDSNPGAGYEKC